MSFTDQANKDGHGHVDPFASSIVASNHPFASIANDENRDLNTTINNQEQYTLASIKRNYVN